MSASIMQDEKECYLTGVQAGLDKHHIYHGTANRKISEQWGCWCWLKHSIHMDLHDRDKELDRFLQKECQKAFEAKYSHKKFMELFGKNYLDKEEP